VDRYRPEQMRYQVTLETGPAAGRTLALSYSKLRQIVRSARVIGTWDRPELHGAIAPAASYDSELGRYRVRGVTCDGSILAIKPENILLPPRTMVTVKSSPHRPSLSGRKGRIVDIENAKQLYTIQLDNNEHIRLQYGAVLA
jgi:hypothetical protein